jgi:undecaprenyl-diphosphatase
MEFLLNLDLSVFYFINHFISNSFFDKLMPYITEIDNWYLVYIFLFSWLFWKGGKNGRIAGVAIILAIILTDQVNSSFLKELFDRTRPCHSLSDVHLLVTCGAGKSMPSSHAANNFALALILSYFFRQYRYVYYSIATFIAISRVYVGVHYPADVIVGAFVGTTISLILVLIIQKFFKFQRT